MEHHPEVTAWINQAMQGRGEVQAELVGAIYSELRRIAQAQMAGEKRDHTLQATALVNEAYLRLVAGAQLDWRSRGHFFQAAAEAMRRILVDYARRRGRLKRGGGQERVDPGGLELVAEEDPTEILALDEALRRLEEQDPSMARVVQLRFFAGLGVEETAHALGVSPRTVKREWAYARAWLYRSLRAGESSQGAPPRSGD